MVFSVEIPRPIDEKLVEKARAAGLEVVAYAERVLKADALLDPLDQVLSPVRKSFQSSGLTEDQVIEQYEIEKHAARASKRGQPFSE